MRGNAQLVNGRARLIHRSRCSFNQPAFVSLALRYPRSHVVFHPFELLGKYRPPYYFLPTYVALHISSIPALPFYPLYPLRFYPSALTTIFPFVSSRPYSTFINIRIFPFHSSFSSRSLNRVLLIIPKFYFCSLYSLHTSTLSTLIDDNFTFVPTFPFFTRSSTLSLSDQCNNTKPILPLSLDPLRSNYISFPHHFLSLSILPPSIPPPSPTTTIFHPSSPSFHFLPRQIPTPPPAFSISFIPLAHTLGNTLCAHPLVSLPPVHQLLPFIAPFPPILPPRSRGFILALPPPPTHPPPSLRSSRVGTPSCAAIPLFSERERRPETLRWRVKLRHGSAEFSRAIRPCLFTCRPRVHFRVPCFRGPSKGKKKRGGKRERRGASGKEVDSRVRWSRSERPATIDAR